MATPLRVLLVTQLFQPEPNHLKGLEFAAAVRSAGVDLRVLTGFPNYPGGRLYPGYRIRPVRREVIDGVPVVRVPMFPSHDRSSVRRALTYLTFAASASVAACVGRFRPDIVHAYVGPITLSVPAWLARVTRGARTLLDVQDLWPESATASGMIGTGPLAAMADGFSRWAYRHSDRVLVLSDGYKQALAVRGVPGDRIDVVHNWCDEAQIPPPATARPSDESTAGALRVLYAGNIGSVQGLDVVLDAARILRDRRVNVEFTLAGTGVELERLRLRLEREGIEGVRFVGAVPPAQVGALYDRSDALLVHLRDTPLSRIAIPQKTQMCLAAGRPVLIGVRGQATRLVEEAAAGVAFEPEKPDSLADAVARLVSMGGPSRRELGERGRQFYMERLSFRRGVEATLNIYRSMAAGSAR